MPCNLQFYIMIRFGFYFDSLDDLKVFSSEIIGLYNVSDYREARPHLLSFSVDCGKSFGAFMLIGDVHTILRNLCMYERVHIYSIEFYEKLQV